MNHLLIGDVELELVKLGFEPFYSESTDQLVWGVEAVAAAHPMGFEPRLVADVLWTTGPGDFPGWRGLAGKRVDWSLSNPDEESPVSLYTWEQNPIVSGSLELRVVDQRTIGLQLSGVCDLSSDELSAATEVALDAIVLDWGISIATTDLAFARRELGRHLTLDDYDHQRVADSIRLVPKR